MMDGLQPVADRAEVLDNIERIEVVDVAANDTIVLYPKSGLALEDLRAIREAVAKIWPHNRVVVVAGLDHIEVQRPATYGFDPVW